MVTSDPVAKACFRKQAAFAQISGHRCVEKRLRRTHGVQVLLRIRVILDAIDRGYNIAVEARDPV